MLRLTFEVDKTFKVRYDGVPLVHRDTSLVLSLSVKGYHGYIGEGEVTPGVKSADISTDV